MSTKRLCLNTKRNGKKLERSNVVHADTNRLMDKCGQCGGHPGLEIDSTYRKLQFRGHCTDCCVCVHEWDDAWGIAIIAWNKEQRKGKIYERLAKSEDSNVAIERILERDAKVKRGKACVGSKARV